MFAAGCSDGPTDPSVQVQATVAHFLPSHSALRAKLRRILEERNGGLGFEMWATILSAAPAPQQTQFLASARHPKL